MLPGFDLNPDKLILNIVEFTMNILEADNSYYIPDKREYKYFEYTSVLHEDYAVVDGEVVNEEFPSLLFAYTYSPAEIQVNWIRNVYNI